MLYMVIEHFKTPGAIEIYRRARDRGRLLPDGLEYISSWVDPEMTRCFQLMKTDHERLLEEWIDRWKDLINFEIVPVMTSAETIQAIAPRL